VIGYRSGKHSDEHDASFTEAHDLSDRGGGVLVADDYALARREYHPEDGVADVAVREPIAVAPLIVEPESPLHELSVGPIGHRRLVSRRD
jgi:hypothetical protein